MKKTLALLAASTALTAAIGVPAWSAMYIPDGVGDRPFAAVFDEPRQALAATLVSGKDDGDEDRRRSRYDRDEDDDDECDDDDDDDDDDSCRSAGNPAPAGTVAPPQNGLFGNGAPPQVRVN